MMTEPTEFSFLPDDYHERSVRRRLFAGGAAVLIVCALATAAALYVSEQSLWHVTRRHAEMTRAFDLAVQRGGQANTLRNESDSLTERARRMMALAVAIPSSRLLSEVTGAIPSTASLTSLAIQSAPRLMATNAGSTAFDLKKAALESRRRTAPDALPDVPPTDVTLRISGMADTNMAVSQFRENLTRSAILQDVRIVVSEITAVPGATDSTIRRFQIEATLNPLAEVNRAPLDSAAASIGDDAATDNAANRETP